MSVMERVAQAKQLSNYFMRLKINKNSASSNENNNSCGHIQQPEQRPREIANNNATSEPRSPPKVITPRGTQSLPTELLKKRKRYQSRVQPYVFPTHVKARKSLKF